MHIILVFSNLIPRALVSDFSPNLEETFVSVYNEEALRCTSFFDSEKIINQNKPLWGRKGFRQVRVLGERLRVEVSETR